MKNLHPNVSLRHATAATVTAVSLVLLLLHIFVLLLSPTAAAHASAAAAARLAVSGSGFTLRGNPVFLSGANLAWLDYGNDFGNKQSNGVACALQQAVRNVTDSGGNTIRIWLFVEGDNIPAFDDKESGRVVATDNAGTLTADIELLLDYAASQNVFVNLCLWNGAVLRQQHTIDLIRDVQGDRVTSLLNTVITPLATAFKGHPGLGAWEIFNELEGSLELVSDTNEPCYDTKSVLGSTGAGWAGSHFTMQQALRFVGLQAAAIHKADPDALVTSGAWSEHSVADFPSYQGQGYRNYYSDRCLSLASGQPLMVARLDFVQIHSYPKHAPGSAALNSSRPFCPFSLDAVAYKAGKPVVIGEFSAHTAGAPNADLMNWAYQRGYAGAWDWAISGGDPTDAALFAGVAALRNKPGVPVALNGTAPPDTCSCSDHAPPGGGYTCAQQAGWGKCDQGFMKGFCCRSCHACKGCK